MGKLGNWKIRQQKNGIGKKGQHKSKCQKKNGNEKTLQR